MPPARLLALFCAIAPCVARAAPETVGGRRGMVVSSSPLASRVGREVLERGGNAVDAAVAVGLALAVTWPMAGNLGGGGFTLVRRADGRAEVIDYRERAPAAATRDMYLDPATRRPRPDASTLGHLSVAVPGTVAGLALLLERHGSGRLAFRDLVEPARKLAAEGFALDRQGIAFLRRGAAALARSADARRIFLRDGHPFELGDRLVQPELAATLARLEREGPRELYTGETARRIADDMKAHGGLVTLADLAAYKPVVRAPLVGSYRGHQVITVPPPSSGGAALLEMLNLLERHDVKRLGHGSADELHLLVEVMRRAFADRSEFLGDPDFVKVPVERLVGKEHAAKLDATIDPARATPSAAVKPVAAPAPVRAAPSAAPPRGERPETTHFAVVDGDGNVAATTCTLNGLFGSGVIASGTGFLLNDEMDDFASAPGVPNMFGLVQGEANAIAPGKRPLSSMTPTLLVKDGKLELAIGTPGGPTIINTVLQVIVNMVDFGMNLAEAIDAPRVHHQWLPDAILVEPWGLSADTRRELERRGHHFDAREAYLGDAEGIAIAPDGQRLGVSDRRSGGSPAAF